MAAPDCVDEMYINENDLILDETRSFMIQLLLDKQVVI